MNQKEHRLHIAILGLLVVAEVLSVISLFHYLKFSLGYESPSFCNINEALNCDAVTVSAYSTLFGIPQASYGIMFYLVMFLLAWAALFKGRILAVQKINQILFILSLWSVVYSVFLFLLSELVIGTLCPTCLAMYCCNFLLLYCGARLLPGYSWNIAREGWSSTFAFLRMIAPGNRSPEALLAKRQTILFILVAIITLCLPWAAHRIIGEREVLQQQETEASDLIRQWDEAKPLSFSFEREGARRDYARGNPFAPVVLVEYSDFECPFCQKFAFDLNELLADFGDQIQIIFKNFPLDRSCNSMVQRDMHRNSCFLAQLARCAGEQDRFWEIAEYLMSLKEGLETRDRHALVKDAVKALDLDGVGLAECMNSGRQLEKVRADVLEGISLKLDHTPTLFINGRKVDIGDRAALRELIRHIATR